MKNKILEKYSVALFLFLLAVVFTPLFHDAFYAPKILLGGLFLALLLWLNGIEKITQSPLKIPVIILMLLSGFNLIINGNFKFLGGNYLALLVILFILVIVSGTHIGRDSINTVHKILVLSVSVISVYSILQYYGLVGEFSRFTATTPFPYATLGNRNYVADYLVLLLPFLLIQMEKKKYFFIIPLSVILWALTLTKSWRALTGIAAIMLVYFIFSRGGLRKIYGFLLGAIIILGSLFVINNRAGIHATNLKPRFLMWKVSLNMFVDSPILGQGVGTFSYNYPDFQSEFFSKKQNLKYTQYAQSPERANNEYLHILAEMGILGFLAVIWLFYVWFKKVDKTDRSFNLPLVAGISAVLVNAFWGFPFHRPSIALTMALLMGISLKPLKGIKSMGTGTFRWLSPHKNINTVLIIFCLFFVSMKIAEQINWEKGRRAYEKDSFVDAQKHTKSALTFSTMPGRIHFLRGRVFYGMGDTEKTIESYNSASLTYNHWSLYFNRGLAYLRTNRLAEALQDMEKTILIIPSFRPAYDIRQKLKGKSEK